ncbi:DegV family protein [Acholeplasma sp. OttesenSCG-928-E16]|nr:DegV family protein [Acholeplasma sp. OttesenSCG-928-E16]
MKNKFEIIIDTTADLPVDLVEKYDFKVIPLTFSFDGKKTYQHNFDFSAMSVAEFYEKVRAGGHATTAQLNSEDYKVVLEPLLKEGKDCLVLAFSSGLSGTYNSGRMAVEELREKYPDRQLEIVDTLAASAGEGMLDYLCALEREKGKSLSEVKEFAENTKNHLTHYFTVTDINHLRRGGRISKTAAVLAKILSIKPVLHVNDAGKLINIGKVPGRKKSLEKLFSMMEETIIDNKVFFISHADDLEAANFLAMLIKDKYPSAQITIGYIGPIIGAHAGPGTIALFFLGKHK